MTDAAKAMSSIRRVDGYSCRKTALSPLNPVSHLTVTLVFVVLVVSVGRYEPAMLAAYAVYPAITLVLGDIPFGVILKRVLPALPAVIFLGIFNPFLDKNHILLGDIVISAGWLSLLSLVIKCALTVSAALILVCIAGIDGVCASLRIFKIPDLIIAQLAFTYRYIHVLGEEAVRVLTAYKLRAPMSRGVSPARFGPLCGGLFLRSAKRAENIYAAMRCRGFNGVFPSAPRNMSSADYRYILLWTTFFVFARLINLPEELGNILLGL